MPDNEDSGRETEASIIIPHYDDKTRLRKCLSALFSQDLTGIEVIVADNATPGGTKDIALEFPATHIVVQSEKGAAAARNKGVEIARGRALLFLDADCIPSPSWVETALDITREGIVNGGRIEVFDETAPPRSGPEAFEAVFSFDQKGYVENKGFSVTANMVTQRADFLRIGPFRNDRSEDVDWCHRATADGMRIFYSDNLVVLHPSRSDWTSLRKKWRRLTQEMFMLRASKSFPARLNWALKGLAMPVSAIIHTPRLVFSSKLDGIGERWRGLLALHRLRWLRGWWMLCQALGGRA